MDFDEQDRGQQGLLQVDAMSKMQVGSKNLMVGSLFFMAAVAVYAMTVQAKAVLLTKVVLAEAELAKSRTTATTTTTTIEDTTTADAIGCHLDCFEIASRKKCCSIIRFMDMFQTDSTAVEDEEASIIELDHYYDSSLHYFLDG